MAEKRNAQISAGADLDHLGVRCFLSPLGQHRRRSVNRSKGKRAKRRSRRRDKDSGGSVAEARPPLPGLIRHTTIGFNSTIRRLQELAGNPISSATPYSAENNGLSPVKEIAVVFACVFTLPTLLTSSLPALVAAASAAHPSDPPIRLVTLPPHAEKLLADALFQPRVGLVGIHQDAPGAEDLIAMAIDKVSAVQAPWLPTAASAESMPASIDLTSPTAGEAENHTYGLQMASDRTSALQSSEFSNVRKGFVSH